MELPKPATAPPETTASSGLDLLEQLITRVEATLAAATLLACYLPTHRSARVSPVIALRNE